MSRKRKPLLIIIAAVLAGGAALLAFDYLSAGKSAAAPVAMRPVIVAARAINAREAINSTMIQAVMRPSDAVDPGAFASTAALAGDVALADIPMGAALTSSNVARAALLPSVLHLNHGMRAMSIGVDEVKDVSGLLQPGDHVDVYAVTPRAADAQPQAFAIMRNIVVLGVGGQVSAPSSTPGSPPAQWRSVTLAVSASQAKILAVADMNSTIRLALRPPDETTRSEPIDAFTLTTGATPHFEGPIAPAVAVAAPAPAPAPAPAAKGAVAPPAGSSHGGVEYILGDQVSGSGNP